MTTRPPDPPLCRATHPETGEQCALPAFHRWQKRTTPHRGQTTRVEWMSARPPGVRICIVHAEVYTTDGAINEVTVQPTTAEGQFAARCEKPLVALYAPTIDAALRAVAMKIEEIRRERD